MMQKNLKRLLEHQVALMQIKVRKNMNQYPTLHVLGPNPGTYGDMAGKKVLPDLTVDRVARTNQEVVERTVSNG